MCVLFMHMCYMFTVGMLRLGCGGGAWSFSYATGMHHEFKNTVYIYFCFPIHRWKCHLVEDGWWNSDPIPSHLSTPLMMILMSYFVVRSKHLLMTINASVTHKGPASYNCSLLHLQIWKHAACCRSPLLMLPKRRREKNHFSFRYK